MVINQFYDINDFLSQIENIKKKKNVEYIEAVILWCEDNNLEIETAAGLIKKDSVIKDKIQYEAERSEEHTSELQSH